MVLQHSISYIGTWNSEKILQFLPWENLFQMMHQCLVLAVKVALYFCASETGVLYTSIVYFYSASISNALPIL